MGKPRNKGIACASEERRFSIGLCLFWAGSAAGGRSLPPSRNGLAPEDHRETSLTQIPPPLRAGGVGLRHNGNDQDVACLPRTRLLRASPPRDHPSGGNRTAELPLRVACLCSRRLYDTESSRPTGRRRRHRCNRGLRARRAREPRKGFGGWARQLPCSRTDGTDRLPIGSGRSIPSSSHRHPEDRPVRKAAHAFRERHIVGDPVVTGPYAVFSIAVPSGSRTAVAARPKRPLPSPWERAPPVTRTATSPGPGEILRGPPHGWRWRRAATAPDATHPRRRAFPSAGSLKKRNPPGATWTATCAASGWNVHRVAPGAGERPETAVDRRFPACATCVIGRPCKAANGGMIGGEEHERSPSREEVAAQGVARRGRAPRR